MTTLPGVYTMLNESGVVIYVGKAKNLKNRLSSYFNRKLDTKTIQLVSQIHSIEVTVAPSEREALLLEISLIKQLKPRYNIIFKDDKDYPYIFISVEHAYPSIVYHRGSKKLKGQYFGPYPSGQAVRESILLLQKLFKIRVCDDIYFKNRSRPCLQFQIKRCSGPCTQLIADKEYQADVQNALLFLKGEDSRILETFLVKMEEASINQEYEQAAKLRDQINLLRDLRKQQIILSTRGDVDVLGIAIAHDKVCIHILYIRLGRMLGSRQYFPKINTMIDESKEHILSSFITHHYISHIDLNYPKEILLPFGLPDKAILRNLLLEHSGKTLKLSEQLRGDRQKWLNMATQSATEALKSHYSKSVLFLQKFNELKEVLALDNIPARIECFDISHTGGEATVGSCVVFTPDGPCNKAYRRFNIKTTDIGDDYAAMEEVLTRHYSFLKKEERTMPSLVLIDGGKGQLGRAIKVFKDLEIFDTVLVGVAKGLGRKAGLEKLIVAPEFIEYHLPPDSKALHLIQNIRDEAHRFAITAHKKKRDNSRVKSVLENIEGVGFNRRRLLLRTLGGIQEVKGASLEELTQVAGISHTLALRIYRALHEHS